MFDVPFRPNNTFVGRNDTLAEMERTIHDNRMTGGCVPLVLSGIGGMGKTQLMLRYSFLHRTNYNDIFWIQADGRPTALDSFRRLAVKLGVCRVNEQMADHELADLLCSWFQSRTERWLLLLDNMTSVDDVSTFIPIYGGNVIVTTRNHVDKSWGSVIHVDKMSKDDAISLLLGREKHNIHAEKIVNELDCMPLAVDIVRAYIARTGTSFKAYLETYQRERDLLFANDKDTKLVQYKHSIDTVWLLSFEAMRNQNSLAPVILGACAFLQPDVIPVSLFERQSVTLGLKADVAAVRAAIGVLVEFSFVRRSVINDIGIDAGADERSSGDNYDPARDIMAIH